MLEVQLNKLINANEPINLLNSFRPPQEKNNKNVGVWTEGEIPSWLTNNYNLNNRKFSFSLLRENSSSIPVYNKSKPLIIFHSHLFFSHEG